MQNDLVVRFKTLFTGNPSAYGVYSLKGDKPASFTKTNPVSHKEYEHHLKYNTVGLGVIPVIDSDTSGFGVLDFDNHHEKDGIDLIGLAKRIKDLNLPLVLCRSKSGGAHAFLFGSAPLNTRVLRQTLKKFAGRLRGFGELDVEIFPKQERVDKDSPGNWINLPYFDAHDTHRYAIINGQKASLEEFLDMAEKKAITTQNLIKLNGDAHAEAPPCIEFFLNTVTGEGQRNILLFHFGVYAKRAFPESWQQVVATFNAENFKNPLDHDECQSVINSLSKEKAEEYRYKCKEDICKSVCKSEVCVKRKYGITETDQSQLLLSSIPGIGVLRKYNMTPPRYELEIQGSTLAFTSAEILDFRQFKRVMFEKLDIVLKPIKNEKWLEILRLMMEKIDHVDVPEDASQIGLIRQEILEFIKKANLKDEGLNREKRSKILTGNPIVIKRKDGVRFVVFKGGAFRQYIANKRYGSLKIYDLWDAARSLGVSAFKVRCGTHTPIAVWGVPLIDDTEHPNIPDFGRLEEQEIMSKGEDIDDIPDMDSTAETTPEEVKKETVDPEIKKQFEPEF